jgi:hypothetical protein
MRPWTIDAALYNPQAMSAPPAAPTPRDTTYIRGGGGVEVDTGRVVRFVVACCVLVLVGVVIDMTISAADQNSRVTRLRHQGVPVEVTVTGCVGYGSGIGQGVVYYTCRGTYGFGGRRYNEVIGGIRNDLAVGQTLRAVTVPGHPALVSTADSVARTSSSWTAYVTPIVLGVVTVVLILGLVLWPKRTAAEPQEAGDPVDAGGGRDHD